MAVPQEQLKLLKQFIQICKQNPNILHSPEMAFYTDYLRSLGATIPPPSSKGSASHESEGGSSKPEPQPHVETPPEETLPSEPESEPEPEPEFGDDVKVEPDVAEPLPVGDDGIEVSEEDQDKANEKRHEAQEAFSEGNHDQALKCYTEAIQLNPHSALSYAKRASVLLRLKKPNAAIRDCNKAISLNADSAQPYKFRGRAKRLLGAYVEALLDLATACKLDYDDQANEWLKEVEPFAKKVQEHKRKLERKKEEKEEAARRERVRKAKEAYEKAKKEEEERANCCDEGECGGHGGFPGAGAGGMPDISSLMSDPEIMQLFADPDVQAAFADVSKNPANIGKYQSNPKVAKVIEKMASKMGAGGGGGFPFPFPGAGAGGFGGAPAGSGGHSKGPDIDVD